MTQISDSERRRAFSIWLRTGRLPGVIITGNVELKFNPWHDPADGRFTFAGSGRNYGQSGSGGFRGGGGGSFGGAGASGDWGDASPGQPQVSRARATAAKRQALSPMATTGQRPGGATATTPLHREIRNGYEYQIDDTGRTHRVSGTLKLAGGQLRSRTTQARAGGADRRPTDDGGHYIAVRFVGPTDAFNHFAQDANFNRGQYRLLENQWAREKRAGRNVTVKIVPSYDGGSKRPSVIDIWFTIDGHEESVKLANEPKEKRRGK